MRSFKHAQIKRYSFLAIALAAGTAAVFYNSKQDLMTMKIGPKEIEIEIASDLASRARGLSGRESIAKNKGLLMVFEKPDKHGIWMKDMKFPIDIFWIKDGKIIHLEKNVQPSAPSTPDSSLPVFQPFMEADSVLETAAGFVEENRIKLGDPAQLD